jgi:hypothetical protein
MAVIQISRIQQRRGLEADLPSLSSAELGWSVDTRKLYIGNGTTEEGAPSLGKTEILTQYSILDFETSFAANVATLQGNVIVLEGNIVALTAAVAAVTDVTVHRALTAGASAATITNVTANNAVISYTISQGSQQRTGKINVSRISNVVSYEEDYTETGTTDIVFTMNANVTHTNLNYSASTGANLTYSIKSLV